MSDEAKTTPAAGVIDAALEVSAQAVSTACQQHFCGLAMSAAQATAVTTFAMMKAFDAMPLGLLRETYGESAAEFVGAVRAELFHRVRGSGEAS